MRHHLVSSVTLNLIITIPITLKHFSSVCDLAILGKHMAQLGNIFFKYLAREFLGKFAMFLVILIGIVYVFDTIELVRRASGETIPMSAVFVLALYKSPDVGQQILPFITLFAALATFRSLSERQELVCIRSAGLSAWQFIIPIVSTTLALSLIYLMVVHPLSAAAMAKYKSLQNLYFGDGIETVSVIDDGLWIKQEDKTGNFILKAGELDAQTWTMADVTVFFFDTDNNHIQRIDAKTAELKPDMWAFDTVSIHRIGQPPSVVPTLSLPTTLTSQTITESFSNPQTISFWRLPYFIKSVRKTGLETTEIQAYYQSLLAQPLMLVSMVFMAAAIALRTTRTSGLMPIITAGISFGFIAFFLSGFLRALSMGHEIPIVMGSWAAPLLILLTGVTFLSQLEDG